MALLESYPIVDAHELRLPTRSQIWSKFVKTGEARFMLLHVETESLLLASDRHRLTQYWRRNKRKRIKKS